MAGFVLPDAPAALAGKAVKAWSEAVSIPTYLPMPPDKNPMFLEKRVYQGSSGRVYPLPFIDRISEKKTDRLWQAIHIENEYVRLMILPELGGRIHVGLDKTNGYDFFYRQNVIKPALVGLAGPWISGGVEFNWPQHHRPSTFMPVDTHIEEHADGSVTVWCSEHEPMTRMKGMHGIHLKPGSSLIEVKVRLYNRTELPQTFLWWANVAVRVHEKYQSFFPPDVQYVADHAKRAMSRFPLCEGKYYGVDYGERRKKQEAGSKEQAGDVRFPPGDYPRNDLSWYANIPVPTSYMILDTKEDFFGGYDHAAQAGFVHVADHHIAPGKKQWTWGNHPFGYAWDRHLTDPTPAIPGTAGGETCAPYIELMAGVFTDNQPDFSYLMPGETRAFSQFWYPIQKIGPVQKANTRAGLSLTLSTDKKTARIGVAVTSKLAGGRIELRCGEQVVFDSASPGIAIPGLTSPLTPDAPFVANFPLPAGAKLTDLRLALYRDHEDILAYEPADIPQKSVPEPAKEPALPDAVASVDELYLIGLHLEQYRHATRSPEAYWREALKRDPADSRCNNALGLWHLRRGEFGKAVTHFQTAVTTLTKYNPNPRDGEPHYNLGVALRYLNRLDVADEAFGKAAWNEAWQAAAHFAMAQLDCLGRNWNGAIHHLDASLKANPGPMQAMNLKVLVLRRSRRGTEAEDQLDENKKHDPLDLMVKFLNTDEVGCDRQIRIDLALELARAGFLGEAHDVLDDREWDRRSAPATDPTWMHCVENGGPTGPLNGYYLSYFAERDKTLGASSATEARKAAAAAPPDYCFPHRLEEIAILLDAITKNPDDPRAPYYLGNLLYDKRRHEEAITWWEKSAKLDRTFPTVWRNLGLGYYNILHDKVAAKGAYQRAFKLTLTPPTEEQELNGDYVPTGGDARILYERDQLAKRMQESPQSRLEELENYPHLVQQRDDLTIEFCALLNLTTQHARALKILQSRNFQPWEGGEGLVLAQWARTHLAMGRNALWRADGTPQEALQHFQAALNPPENLGETWHYLQNNSELHYWAGIAAKAIGKDQAATAQRHFQIAAQSVGDFQGMAVRTISENTFFAGMALHELGGGRPADARLLFEAMLAYAQTLKNTPAKIDYFATSLPTMLLFDEGDAGLQRQQDQHAALIEALARYGLDGERGADKRTARRLLGDILAQDPSHTLAADLMVALDWN